MNHFVTIMCLSLFLCQVAIVGAIEVPVLTVEERSLSLDVDSILEVNETELDFDIYGMFSYDVYLSRPDQESGMYISLFSVYDYMGRLSQSTITELFLLGVLEASEDDAWEVIDNWETKCATGDNVNVYTILDPSESSEIVYLSIWSLGDRNNYVMMISSLDNDTTQKAIGTLTLT